MTTPLSMDDLLALQEDTDFEAKLAQGRDGRGALPQSVWETYAAMANTQGGRILLGAEERADGTLRPVGIRDPRRVTKTLWDNLNNRQIISHNLLRDNDVEVRPCQEVTHPLVLITIPPATRRQRPVYVGENPITGTFRRNFEGDYRCDEATVRRMLAEAVQDTRDADALPGFGFEDLDGESMAAYRNLFRSSKPGHPWLALDDQELLRRLGGWVRERESGREGLTLAGLLMFGQLHTIREEVPTYLLDYQERTGSDPRVRWDHRITTDGTWSGNLFDFYRRVYLKLTEDLRVPFRLGTGSQRVDETAVHEALREALVNTLIHADHRQSVGILVVKHLDRFEFRNPGRLRIPRSLALQGGTSDCRNRNLQKMFQMIGAGEQAGSGVPRILEAWHEQHWRAPLLEENLEPEQTTLRLTMVSLLPQAVIDELDDRFGDDFRAMADTERLALATALIEDRVTNERLREICGAHPSDLTVVLRKLVHGNFLDRYGPNRGAYYRLPHAAPRGAGMVDLFSGGPAPQPRKPKIRSSDLLATLNERQRIALSRVEEQGSITSPEYKRLVQASLRTVIRDLNDLVSKELLQRVGRGANTKYVPGAFVTGRDRS
ncbi:MAG: putative DNA binding domain-containing protein [Gemmatimonadetes bacterium]|nr:putative DNA binding domain-containing protein [Gemmatimonadota bacterium]